VYNKSNCKPPIVFTFKIYTVKKKSIDLKYLLEYI
jgi:hypothetical protein